MKPFIKENSIKFQITFYEEKKNFHKNVEKSEAADEIITAFGEFKQMAVVSDEYDYQILNNGAGKVKIIKKKKEGKKEIVIAGHNRKKEYLIEEGVPCDFLIELGVMTKEGKVTAAKYDKFRQINRYLEFVRDALKEYSGKKIKVVDFGSGKAYLTFALYYYLVKIAGIEAEIYGVDLKKDVIEFCNSVSEKLDYRGLKFVYGDIKSFDLLNNADFVITLHACNNATDDAIIQAMKWNAQIIMCVPCCQHEFFEQMTNSVMPGVLKHGIHKEKVATIVTDSVRGNILEIMGYDVKIMEFIDMEHTPKNILIKGVKIKKESEERRKKAVEEYKKLKSFWGINPYIERELEKELGIKIE